MSRIVSPVGLFSNVQAPDSALHPAAGQGQQHPAQGAQQLLARGRDGSEAVEAPEGEAPARLHQGPGQLPASAEVCCSEGEGRD